MKCYSYLRSDLERHFKDMCRRYHILFGLDDPSLKHAFLAFIPKDLVDKTFRLFKTRKEVIDNQSLGTIFHQVLEGLKKYVININISPRYYSLIKLCSKLAND